VPSAERVRMWWEGEIRIALEDPEVAAHRKRWRETWREREVAGEPVMTIPELLDALTACGMERGANPGRGPGRYRPGRR
jgi:hypothetical protein